MQRLINAVPNHIEEPALATCVAELLGEVREVFIRLRELEERGLPDAADVEQSFADLYAEGGLASAVEIMTIHKAKGLEFDFVVVPALDRHARIAAVRDQEAIRELPDRRRKVPGPYVLGAPGRWQACSRGDRSQ